MLTSSFFLDFDAVLIDKDNNPKWKPTRLEEVSDETVNAYFEPPKVKDFNELKL